MKPEVLALYSYFFYTQTIDIPSLLIVPDGTVGDWKKSINLYMPNLNYIDYSVFNETEDLVSRNEFYNRQYLSIKFDVLILTYESLLFYSKYLLHLQWRSVTLVNLFYQEKISSVLKILNSAPQMHTQFKLQIIIDHDQGGSAGKTGIDLNREISDKIYHGINSIR